MKNTELFDYDDVRLIPKKGILKSRSEADVSVEFGGHRFKLPAVPANMSTVIDNKLAEYLAKNGYFYVIHRFDIDPVDFTTDFHNKGLIASISLGIKEKDREDTLRLAKLSKSPEFITIDVAHGHSDEVISMVSFVKEHLPDSFLIAGNIATPEAAIDLEEAGADSVKVGIGPGCFAAGTRVLMNNGTYKNIEDIQVDEKVINMNGDAVKVKAVKNSGKRLVQKYKHTNWHTSSYATSDHKHFAITGENLSPVTMASKSLASISSSSIKSQKDKSRNQWMELGDTNMIGMLFPKKLNLELNDSFAIDIKGLEKRSTNSVKKETLKPNYELGYIFGTFLGDGSVYQPQKTRDSGKVSWTFGKNESYIVEKLQSALYDTFNKKAKVYEPTNKNVISVEFNSSSVARLFSIFGKKENKNLPKEYLVNNIDYQKGLYDGLIDSDGHKEKDGRDTFTNTSENLIELMYILSFNIFGVLPSGIEHNNVNPGGGLKGITEDSTFNKSYRTRKPTSAENKLTQDFFCVKMTQAPTDWEAVETYDIEVDCETHSFIANNVIVHNSACTTAPNTGFGTQGWQLSAVYEVSGVVDIPVIADGGIRHYGDIAKAVSFGASMVMIGSMFAGHDENPGEIIEQDGEKFKVFFGSASEHQKGEKKHVEGKKLMLPYKGAIADTLKTIEENLQSSVSYAGGSQLEDLYLVDFIIL